MGTQVEKKRQAVESPAVSRDNRAHAYYPLEAHEIIVTEIIPALRKMGVRKSIQDIVSEGVDMVVTKYLGELARHKG